MPRALPDTQRQESWLERHVLELLLSNVLHRDVDTSERGITAELLVLPGGVLDIRSTSKTGQSHRFRPLILSTTALRTWAERLQLGRTETDD